MALVLVAGEGPLKDQVFTLFSGLTFGRSEATIEIQDPMVSTSHARVTKDDKDLWFLVDNDSKNGIRVQNERVAYLELKPGVTFQLGPQEFTVKEDGVSSPQGKPKKQGKYWYDALADFLARNSKSFQDRVKTFQPMDPALVLEFVRGIQVNSKWIIGYGPRKIGSGSIDLPIWQPGAPHTCFEIHPTAQGLLFTTDNPDVVLLNDRPVNSKVLLAGDTIKIMDTIIEVDFLE